MKRMVPASANGNIRTTLVFVVIVVVSLATCAPPWANRSTLQLIHSDDVPKSLVASHKEHNYQQHGKIGKIQ